MPPADCLSLKLNTLHKGWCLFYVFYLQSHYQVQRKTDHLRAPCFAHYFGGLQCQQVILYQKRIALPLPYTLHLTAGEVNAALTTQQIVVRMPGWARAMGQGWWASGRSSCWLIKGTRVKSGPHQAQPYAHMQTTAAWWWISPLNSSSRGSIFSQLWGDFSCCSVTCFDAPLRRCPIGQQSSRRSRAFSLASTFLYLHCRRMRGKETVDEQRRHSPSSFHYPKLSLSLPN